jgi:hypothetical protein
MAVGPLAVRWHDWALEDVHAGAVTFARVEVENAGTVRWNDEIRLAYHWLDDRGNPIVWDGDRTHVPHLAPGERAEIRPRVRGPIPPGRYGFAFDLVAEFRAWFKELGGEDLRTTVDVAPRDEPAHAEVPPWVEPAADWHERVRSTHAEGYAVVAGAVDWTGGALQPRPRALAPYEPGPGRIPGFPHPLVCPSVVESVELERLEDVAGLPAFAAPASDPWIYDGRIVLRARARSGRRSA